MRIRGIAVALALVIRGLRIFAQDPSTARLVSSDLARDLKLIDGADSPGPVQQPADIKWTPRGLGLTLKADR
jgi:hypothetical protein